MAASPRLLFLVPYPITTTAVTATAFTTVAGGSGVLVPADELRALAGAGQGAGVFVSLLAWLETPVVTSGATVEARLLVQRNGSTLATLAGGQLRVSSLAASPAVGSGIVGLVGALVDVTALLATTPLLGFRLQARTTTGTANLYLPTVAFYRTNQP